MKHYEQVQQGRLIGALLRVPFLAVVEAIYKQMIADGFDDLTYAHLAVFRHINEGKGSRLIDLAAEAQMAKQSMSYLVDSLEAQGYVVRTLDENDGRVRLIRLTARGKEAMHSAREATRSIEKQWTAHLGSERMECLLDALRDLTTLLEGK